MTPQLIGTKKSKGFRRCERYCKERSIPFQPRDPLEKPLSTGEIESILRGVDDPRDLIDTEARAYRSKGLAWMDYDPLEEIMEEPELLRQPIVRTDHGVAIDPDATVLDRLFRD